MNARRRLWSVLMLILAVGTAATLTIMALRRNLTYLYMPSEVLRGDTAQQTHFRLGGIVEKGSFQRTSGTLHTRFIVTDGNARLQVRYARILPDLFREGQAVVATGQMQHGIFIAENILARHNETYTPRTLTNKMQPTPTQHTHLDTPIAQTTP
ncbi:cytochrome c maturation protein CcmE [Xylella fastidiosa]|uniref:cytochrome c maturation protein CcmE n=1 Tax=Xylella fastidiosa TaxID=2371 RepID=UPI0007659F49|nr:cytochrome c maturation protein CcmE [Xylella fastidiosa]ALR01358.1 cytochrome C biogenesis protein CcmE [Xylella fastidiosa]KXB13532.1 cytochrome c biogenesis protein CcmE [Xylella fastidiosa]KXB22455.1 cytochrome c biogenesis protein CcmE [Xylella fastidiosa]MDG5823751.1 cytochrome c maturation protein CcmE [Xylella fastidiosa subsp. pauca]MDG5824979.1 cytochrome c maturation protein CcmE [Xylella fastidiosa subsp. pauca]